MLDRFSIRGFRFSQREDELGRQWRRSVETVVRCGGLVLKLLVLLLMSVKLIQLFEITFRSKFGYMWRIHSHGARLMIRHDDRYRGENGRCWTLSNEMKAQDLRSER